MAFGTDFRKPIHIIGKKSNAIWSRVDSLAVKHSCIPAPLIVLTITPRKFAEAVLHAILKFSVIFFKRFLACGSQLNMTNAIEFPVAPIAAIDVA